MRKVATAIYLLYAALIFVTLMIVSCPFIVLSTSILPKRIGKKVAFSILKYWSFIFTSLSFFWLRTVKRRQVDVSRQYIYTANDSSYLDAVAVAYAIPQEFSPLGKIEMTKVPIFGWIYERVVVMIDRSSKESRIRSVNKLKEEIANGTSILLFPEGTMNQTDAVLAPFYDGAFRIAIETQTPILPFVIRNSKKLLPRTDPLLAMPGIIHIIFGEPVESVGLTVSDVALLRERVFKIMEDMMQQPTQQH